MKNYRKEILSIIIFTAWVLFLPRAVFAIPAMSQRCDPSVNCVISEYIFADDGFTPINTDNYCKITITDPADSVVANQVNMSHKADGWYYYTFNAAAPLGNYRSLICCDVGGVTERCMDKTFVLGTSFDSLPAAVWSYTGAALDTASNAIAKVWSYATRQITSRQIGAGAEYIAGVTDAATVTQVADQATQADVQYNVDLVRRATFDFAGLADAGGTTLTLVDSELTDYPDNHWNDYQLVILTGADAGQQQTICSFDKATYTLTVCSAFTGAIGSGDKYIISHERKLISSIWNWSSRQLTSVANVAADVWGYSGGRTLSSFGSLAADVWDNTYAATRKLTSRQIGAGAEYIAGVTDSGAVAQVASSGEVVTLQSDITTIKGNVATLITEIGTGNISAIKTKTDTIAWADVTGLVTTSGQIKAKTDTIDWTNITGIKTNTDTIVWADVTGIKTKTDTIDWTDITTIKGNVATLITEIGTGNISAIKTKTDTIAWADVTGLVTTSGQIKAKTDTIDWTNVTAIKTNTDTIAWGDITGIKTKTDTINWTNITDIRLSQQKDWKVYLSDFGRVLAGDIYRAKLFVLNYESVPTDSAVIPVVTLYDPLRNLTAQNISMTKLSSGIYEYTYLVPTGATQGEWETEISAEVEAGKVVKTNDYWEVEGSPAQVAISSMADVTVPSISANIIISNEGVAGYEYQYEWCVVSQENNTCGGGDDVYRGTGAKYITAGQSWNTTLSAVVNTTGNYWFKLIVYFGTEQSGASRTFAAANTVVTPVNNAGGGGGGGGTAAAATPAPATTETVTLESLWDWIKNILARLTKLENDSATTNSNLAKLDKRLADLDKKLTNAIKTAPAPVRVQQVIVRQPMPELPRPRATIRLQSQ